MSRVRCGFCGYYIGEGYFTNCQSCIDHNDKQPLARRAPVVDDEDFEATPKNSRKRAPGTSYVSQGFPRAGVQVHNKAVAVSASKRQAQAVALQMHVRVAKEVPTAEKARAFVNSIRSPSPTTAACPATAAAPAVSMEITKEVAAACPATAAAPAVSMEITKEVADALVAASGWRRCQTMEKNFRNLNLERDGYEVLFTDRDGDCLFHCFIAILMERQLVNFSSSKKENVAMMRDIIVKGFVQVKNELTCDLLGADGTPFDMTFECQNLISMRSGKGGREAYGGEAEIAMFGKLYNIAVKVFAPETLNGESLTNMGNMDEEFPEEMFLLTLGWRGKQRAPATDHWQRVKHSQPSPLVPVPQQQAPLVPAPLVPAPLVPAPLVPVPQQQALTSAQRKEAAKLRAQEQQKADDDAACQQARNFIAAGGEFNFNETEVIKSGEESEGDGVSQEIHEHGGDGDGDAQEQRGDLPDDDGDDGVDDGEEEREERQLPVGNGQQHLVTDGFISKRKVTHWIHETRITCLRLIQRQNPWTAKDSGVMWQQIADTMHRDTEHIKTTNARGKEVSCQVHSNGSALNMWYNRQLQILDGCYSERKERTISGQAGQLQKAINTRAAQTGDKAAEIEEEWNAIMSLKALQQDAAKASLLKKEKINAQKAMKNDELPDAVVQLACEDDKIRLQAIRLLEKKMKTFAQEEKTLASANRCAVMSPQQIQERDLLQTLKQQRKEAMGKSDDDSAEDERHISTDTNTGRGKTNLKKSFDMMSEKMGELAQFMKEDNDDDKPTTVEDLTGLLNGIDEDIKGGLKLEGEERAQLRMIFLRQYAKHRIHAKKDKHS